MSLDEDSLMYPVMETFYSIQGEGAYQGVPSVFLRLAGCDVGCHWCDVKESWDASLHDSQSVSSLVTFVEEYLTPYVIVTGGEPLMHDLFPITSALHKINRKTHIETSGAHPLTGNWDWITWSPKKFKEPHPQFPVDQVDELKIVIYNKHDLSWAESFRKIVGPHCKLFLQPEWGREPENIPLILSYIQENPHWRLTVQLHKYLELP